MVLNITCHDSCRFINNTETCGSFPGCEWFIPDANDTDAMFAPGYCGPNAAASYGSTGWIGVFLSLVGDIFINIGMNSMKHAHNVNTDEDGKPIKHFIWIPFWWVGVIGIVGGEVGNLIAYGYAPASVVTPMGAIGVVTNVFITYFFLHEPVTKVNVFGVVCIVIGIVVVVYFSPATTIVIKSATFYEDVVQSTECIIYLCIVAVGSMIMIPASKKYGDRHVTVYVVTCAVIASLTIVSAKAFSSLLSSAFVNGFEADWLNPWPYILLVILAGTAVFSMSYINSAMMIFGNSQVVPTYYALFTTASVASAAFVYKEFSCMVDPVQTFLFVFGIVIAVFGVYLVQYGKASEVSPGGDSQISRQNSAAVSNKVADVEMGNANQGAAPYKGGAVEASHVQSFTEKDASSAYPSGGGRDGPSHKGGASADNDNNNNNNNNNQAVFFPSKMEPVGAQAIMGVVVEDKSSAGENIPGAVVASAVTDASVASPPRKRLGTLRPLPAKKSGNKSKSKPEGSGGETVAARPSGGPSVPLGGGMD